MNTYAHAQSHSREGKDQMRHRDPTWHQLMRGRGLPQRPIHTPTQHGSTGGFRWGLRNRRGRLLAFWHIYAGKLKMDIRTCKTTLLLYWFLSEVYEFLLREILKFLFKS